MKDFLNDFTKGCISTAESVSYYQGYNIYIQKWDGIYPTIAVKGQEVIELGSFNIDEIQEELDEILEGE